ncbi:unnamed protein product [Cyprideis torosa]|uniref:Uncharacterized protein n=1 Tax=Cyprideis torosa TaxID=163714 RepID=A0A7R8ZQ09_9CRUS|nr:unnamed protein product [Cyprideis torosa]CAG0891048.1 unnamed protein product [Cyprideis torosa]
MKTYSLAIVILVVLCVSDCKARPAKSDGDYDLYDYIYESSEEVHGMNDYDFHNVLKEKVKGLTIKDLHKEILKESYEPEFSDSESKEESEESKEEKSITESKSGSEEKSNEGDSKSKSKEDSNEEDSKSKSKEDSNEEDSESKSKEDSNEEDSESKSKEDSNEEDSESKSKEGSNEKDSESKSKEDSNEEDSKSKSKEDSNGKDSTSESKEKSGENSKEDGSDEKSKKESKENNSNEDESGDDSEDWDVATTDGIRGSGDYNQWNDNIENDSSGKEDNSKENMDIFGGWWLREGKADESVGDFRAEERSSNTDDSEEDGVEEQDSWNHQKVGENQGSWKYWDAENNWDDGGMNFDQKNWGVDPSWDSKRGWGETQPIVSTAPAQKTLDDGLLWDGQSNFRSIVWRETPQWNSEAISGNADVWQPSEDWQEFNNDGDVTKEESSESTWDKK